MSKEEVYHTNAGRMVPKDAVCERCGGDGHLWEGDLLIGECPMCDGMGYYADMVPDEDE